MYQPIDSIVDFSQPLWSATKDTADQFMLNGKHYVAPLGYSASAMLCYDKDIIDAEGLDDPYELYVNNEWTWKIGRISCPHMLATHRLILSVTV